MFLVIPCACIFTASIYSLYHFCCISYLFIYLFIWLGLGVLSGKHSAVLSNAAVGLRCSLNRCIAGPVC